MTKESETVKQQKKGAGVIGGIMGLGITLSPYILPAAASLAAAAVASVPVIGPAALAVSGVLNATAAYSAIPVITSIAGGAASYILPSMIESRITSAVDTSGHANTTLAKVSGSASKILDGAISAIPYISRDSSIKDNKDNPAEKKAIQVNLDACLRGNLWLASIAGAIAIPFLGITPLCFAFSGTLAANQIIAANQEKSSGKILGKAQRISGAITRRWETCLKRICVRYTFIRGGLSTMGINLGMIENVATIANPITTFFGELVDILKITGCIGITRQDATQQDTTQQDTTQQITNDIEPRSPEEAVTIVDKLSAETKQGKSFLVGLGIALVVAAALVTLASFGIGGAVAAAALASPYLITGISLACGAISSFCAYYFFDRKKVEDYLRNNPRQSSQGVAQSPQTIEQSRAQEVAASNPEVTRAFASSATTTQAQTAAKTGTAAEAGRGLISAGATHHEHDGKARKHPTATAPKPTSRTRERDGG